MHNLLLRGALKTNQPDAPFLSTNSLKAFCRLCLYGTVLLTLAACASTEAVQRHALDGKVWDVDAQRFVDSGVLLERALASDVVLLGETHDNPEHHRVQNRLLNGIGKRRPVSALALEQYDVDQQPDINAIVRAPLAQEDKLERLEKLMRPGWEWPGYRPLIASALHQRVPLVAANISRDTLRSVSRAGFSALGAGEAKRLALHTVWSEAKQEQLENEIFSGHCGKLPQAAAAAMSKAQRARDAVMADRLLAAGSPPVVAIFGRGHVRRDLAVPLYLSARVPGMKVLSIGIVETGASRDPADYATGTLGGLYDYVVFTGAVKREDPCGGIGARPETGR